MTSAAFVVCCRAALAAAMLVQGTDWAELEALEQHADDEAAFLQAVRNLHVVQRPLWQWDLDMAQDLAAQDKQEEAEARYEQARRRMAMVREAYERFVEAYPDNAAGQNYYGELLYDTFGEHPQGVQKWRLAATLDDTFAEPRNNLGIYYCHVGDYEVGLHFFDEALDLAPDNPDFLYNIAQIYLIHPGPVAEHTGWGDRRIYKKAMEYSRRATELLPDDYDLAEDYAVNFFAAPRFDVDPDWDDAAEAWARARALAPAHDKVFYCWLNEARAWMRAPEPERAVAALEQALALRPDSTPAKALLEEARAAAEPAED
jgi:tetratricopeptide (TPR) repeat protein